MIELFLAKSSPHGLAVANMGVVFLRFLFIAFCLYLASQTIMSLPSIRSYLTQSQHQMLYHLIIIAAAGFVVYYVPLLRIIHALGLVRSSRSFLWPDIIISGLALGRMSFAWHYFFRWLERRSS